jgi:hypothetical protein
MGWAWNLARVALTAVIVVAVAELSKRFPRAGALLLSLPLVSILAFIAAWQQHRDLPAISRMARETLVLVPLTLPFFVPLAYAERLGLGFWAAFAVGIGCTSLALTVWLLLTSTG